MGKPSMVGQARIPTHALFGVCVRAITASMSLSSSMSRRLRAVDVSLDSNRFDRLSP